MISTDKCDGSKTACDTRSNLTMEAVFHAVHIPRDNNEDSTNSQECIHIYRDMSDALKIIKEHKKARLMTFKNRSDAETYAKTGRAQNYNDRPAIIVTAPVSEKCSNFKAPKIEELLAFRKLIENGDVKSAKSTMWANPRYLISDADTPVILQIKYRYNAMHVAVKANKPDMCELILETISNPSFMRLYYGSSESRSFLDLEHVQIMLDLYLNTPDRGLNETPLHFAVKFGYKKIVQILVSYCQCIKTLPNKYNQLPLEIICSRRCQEDEDLKQEIRFLLEDQFYVPVLRAEDDTCQPTIGEPFSPTSPSINNFNKDPMSPCLKVRAFAGPMTKSQALEFRRKWKTPPRILSAKKNQGDADDITNSPIANIAMRLQDTEKGLERVGRYLAVEYQVPWKEFWPFLNDFVDFQSDEGLTKLEKYLAQRFEKDYKKRILYSIIKDFTEPEDVRDYKRTSGETDTPEETDKLDISEQVLCNKLFSCTLNSEFDEADEVSDNLEFYTPPSSPELICESLDDDMLTAEEGNTIFIEGSSPTKLDYAVCNALPSVIDCDTYPCIYRWRHDVQLAIKRDPYRFNNTRLKRQLFTNI